MTNVKAAIDFVLRQEDASMTGNVTTLKGNTGSHAIRAGIQLPPRAGGQRLLRPGQDSP